MAWVDGYCARYGELLGLDARWADLVRAHGGASWKAGRSHEGRTIWAYELGDRARPTVFLSSLMHGIELIGGLALLDSVRALLEAGDPLPHLVLMPTVNPDAVADNLGRLRAGKTARRRTNHRGVDLNRNFPWVTETKPRHPFAGSRHAWSPHFVGERPFSEPETRAVRDVAKDVRPAVSVGFHSFGNLVLFPWAYTDRPNPRYPLYRAIADRFCAALRREAYQAKPACGLYPTIGDMDDWLDAEHGTLAYTVEVSQLGKRLLHPLRLLNPFCWMNPMHADRVLDNLVPGVRALVQHAADAVERGAEVDVADARPRRGLVLPRAAR